MQRHLCLTTESAAYTHGREKTVVFQELQSLYYPFPASWPVSDATVPHFLQPSGVLLAGLFSFSAKRACTGTSGV